jgi:class 3 adenylate cyclase
MTAPVRYARTSDGVSIAYCVAGDGPTLIGIPSAPMSHVQLAPDMLPDQFAELAASFKHVWYDSRGSGLSDRTAIDFTLEARLRDLDAVISNVGGGSVALIGAYDAVPVAIAYAAENPDLVSHLVLSDGWSRYSDYLETPTMAADEVLREHDWTIYTETLARVLIGFDDAAFAERFGAYIRQCVEPDALMAAWKANERIDVVEFLPLVRAPTLITHNAKNRFLTVESGKRLAAAIPGAQFRVVDDMARAQWSQTIKDFVLGAPASTGGPAGHTLRTILFTDLVGHSEMMSRLGDERGRAVLREHETITRDVLKAHGGAEVKTMGDGFMASFGSVSKAVECAVALQRAFAEREGEPFSVRVGLNAGEPIEEEGDLFGATVILAARIAARAEGGEILVANAVRELCTGKGFLFADRGEFVAKGFEEPVRVYEVRWRE